MIGYLLLMLTCCSSFIIPNLFLFNQIEELLVRGDRSRWVLVWRNGDCVHTETKYVFSHRNENCTQVCDNILI